MGLKDFLAAHGCHCVLFVDDAPEVRTFMVQILQRYFSQVLVATNGIEALECYNHQPVDLVITDWLMPLMDGWQLGKEIWSKNPRAIIIFLTGIGEEQMLSAPSGRSIYYLSKPLKLSQLQAKIQEAVAADSAI